jgi:hypothetical protein
MCPSGAACLSANCCFSELSTNPTKIVGLAQSGHHYHIIEMSCVLAILLITIC